MNNNVLSVSQQLRAVGAAMLSGSQGLELATNNYFQVMNDRVVGCCALGGVFLSVRPELRTEQVPYDFGASLDDQSEVAHAIMERFPILESTAHNSAFLATCEKQPGFSHERSDVDLAGKLMHVIANVFDTSGVKTDGVQASLKLVADQLDAASVTAQ